MYIKSRTFFGGIHPAGNKQLSSGEPIRAVLPGAKLVYPLTKHIGAPSVPVVSPGERVLVGSLIAKSGGFVGEFIHSSVSGTVKSIEPFLSDNGALVPSVIVENDGLYEKADGVGCERELDSLTPAQILDIIRDSGIIGMGGAGFPLNVKLLPKAPENIRYIIVNAAECEPYITCDHRLMLERAEQIIKGVKAVGRIFPDAAIMIGIEDNKPDALEKLGRLCENEKNINVYSLKTKYPQGGERMLIYALTGAKLNSKMLPADAGCVVLNVSTALAVCNAIYKSTPVISRIVTITGDGALSPCNLEVSTGMLLPDLLEAAGGLKAETKKLISGGPMMGISLSSTAIPVYKTSSAFTALTSDDVSKSHMTECIKCGRCAVVCPERLFPARIAAAVNASNAELFTKLGGMECIECGSCAYTCPAKRPLVQTIRLGKSEARKKK